MKVSSPAAPRWVLDNRVNISRFRWLLKDYLFDPHSNIDLARWTNTVQTAQRHAFRPRKPWISHPGYSLDSSMSVMRRWQHLTHVFTAHVWFSLWRHATTCSQPTVSVSRISPLALWHHAHLNRALCDWDMRSLTLLTVKCLRRDLQLSSEQFAHRAARAVACSDYRTRSRSSNHLQESRLHRSSLFSHGMERCSPKLTISETAGDSIMLKCSVP